mgnify:CR=1 FL=1
MKKIKEDPTAMYDDESDKEKKIRLITLLTSSIQEAEFYDAMDMVFIRKRAMMSDITGQYMLDI